MKLHLLHCFVHNNYTCEPLQTGNDRMTYATSAGSDKPEHPQSLIRLCTGQ